MCVVYGAYAQSTGPVQKLRHWSIWALDKLFAKSAQATREVLPAQQTQQADPASQASKAVPDSVNVQAPGAVANKQPTKAASPRPAHRLVIVIDDCGYNELILRELAALDLKLTYALPARWFLHAEDGYRALASWPLYYVAYANGASCQ